MSLSRLFLFTFASFALVVCSSAQKKKRVDALAIPEVSRDKVICFALYTVHERTLKLTAQFYPLKDGEARVARLEVNTGGKWKQVAETKVIERGWTAPFRVEEWNDQEDTAYRVRHGEKASYEGTIRKNPVDKREIVVVGFTGNSINAGHGGNIPKDDLVSNIKKIKPDLLFFSGDQVYDHRRHYAAWLKFGRDFGEVIKDYPTVTIPDDHDVGQPNLWGHNGKKSTLPGASDGGYIMPVEYVKEVERAQTSHLPDPYDPAPIGRGIGTYFTELNWGRVSFAIVEDRKFKTGPAGMIPRQGPRPGPHSESGVRSEIRRCPGSGSSGRTPTEVPRRMGQGLDECRFQGCSIPDYLLRRCPHPRTDWRPTSRRPRFQRLASNWTQQGDRRAPQGICLPLCR